MPLPGPFDDPTNMDLSKTLGQKLIPTADKIRNLFTRFGLRPYKVRILRVRWTGRARGVGTPVIEKAMDILPTPRVVDLQTMTEVITPVGLDEVGTVAVTEISGRFTDEQLRFLDERGNPPDFDEEVQYEIEFPRVDGKPGDKRRFYLRGAPFYAASKFQWQIRIEKAHGDRDRNGDVQG